MSEATPSFAAVIQQYGGFRGQPPRTILYSHEREVMNGLTGDQIDTALDSIKGVLLANVPTQQAITNGRAAIDEKFGDASVFATFAQSQLNLDLVIKARESDTRRRASRLSLARDVSAVIFPGYVTVPEDAASVIAEENSVVALIDRFVPISRSLAATLHCPEAGADAYHEATEAMRESRLTEGFVARVALSELSPHWVASPALSSPSVVNRHAYVVKMARNVSKHMWGLSRLFGSEARQSVNS